MLYGCLKLRFLTPILAAGGFAMCLLGCQARPAADVRLGPERRAPERRDLDTVAEDLAANSLAIEDIKADIDVAIVSPFLQRPPQLELNGRLAIMKMEQDGVPVAAVRVDIRHQRESAIDLKGDGEHYEVDMPIMNLHYTGRYGDVLSRVEDRIHFTPVEIANVFNVEGLLTDRIQTLRAYPAHWDFSAIGETDPVELPPRWAINSVERGDADTYPWVNNSLILDEQEQLSIIDNFRPDGTLKTRIWILDQRIVRTEQREATLVPAEFMIWYPPPLEGTVIRVRLSRVEINEGIEDTDIFKF